MVIPNYYDLRDLISIFWMQGKNFLHPIVCDLSKKKKTEPMAYHSAQSLVLDVNNEVAQIIGLAPSLMDLVISGYIDGYFETKYWWAKN